MYEKLTDIFSAVAIKYLKAVDVPKVNVGGKGSNQHEIGGLVKAGFSAFLGLPEGGKTFYFKSVLAYISDDDQEAVICEDSVSWYDTRYHDESRSPEYRLYYSNNPVTSELKEDDFFLVALTKENTLLMIFTPQGSYAERQLRLLFGASDMQTSSSVKRVPFQENELALPVRTILAQLGVDLDTTRESDEDRLEALLEKFGASFPTTRVFSDYARANSLSTDPVESPDDALLTWMEEEENLFRLLERHIVSEKLKAGFGKNGDDVDEFVRFSLSIQNRRKSRSGHAFENHIEEILRQNRVQFERGVRTEGKRTPDFLFPGHAAYHDDNFRTEDLRMLGAKTTCKDRWRQVLAEAERIEKKHLITLQPAISEDQTAEMKEKKLQLVIPEAIQLTYTEAQQEELVSFKGFLSEVNSRIKRIL